MLAFLYLKDYWGNILIEDIKLFFELRRARKLVEYIEFANKLAASPEELKALLK